MDYAKNNFGILKIMYNWAESQSLQIFYFW